MALSERCQRRPLIVQFHLYERDESRIGKGIKIEGRLMVEGLGVPGKRVGATILPTITTNGIGLSFWGDEKVLELDSSNYCSTS